MSADRVAEYKLVFFVPENHAETVKEAVFAAGAGVIGAYRKCAWQTPGQGQFLGDEGSDPAVGSAGQLERVEELRVETRCPKEVAGAVVAALIAAHPYEEPAYDLYPVAILQD